MKSLSLRSRLLALWVMMVLSAGATGFLLVSFFRESATAQVERAQDRTIAACRALSDRYAFFASGWRGPGSAGLDEPLRRQLTGVASAALMRSAGIEGGIWHERDGSLAYAFPTYEGTGPKTDLPTAELGAIKEINADALTEGRPVTVIRRSRSQVLVLHACALRGPIDTLTGWTMTRVQTGVGPAYDRLMIGLGVLAVTVLGSALWLGWVLVTWSRRIAGLEADLADAQAADLPRLSLTGEKELDRLVQALNASGERLSEARRRIAGAERLAAVGRLTAGIAHEIRNPIAAMRLKAENALASPDDARRATALGFVLEQIARLDRLLRDLLAMSQPRDPEVGPVRVCAFLDDVTDEFRDLAAARDIELVVSCDAAVMAEETLPVFDTGEIRRAIGNLLGNALRHTPQGGHVRLSASRRSDRLVISVGDDGPGVPEDIREGLFEPFVTGRPEGTGLGLAIVREIVGAHQGRVRLLPSASGAHFEIELPWHYRPS